MSLEILTSTTAGGSLDAPAAFSSTTAEGAGEGVPFAALLDEQAGADEDLCPQIVEEPAGLGCKRMAETAPVALGSSLSATGFYIPFSANLAASATEVPPDAAAADQDDEAGDETRLDIVALPFAGAPTLADLLVKAEAGASGDTDVSVPQREQLAALMPAESLAVPEADPSVASGPRGAGEAAISADPHATTEAADAFTKAAVSSAPNAEISRLPAVPDDPRQRVDAALRARIVEAYQQPAAAPARAPQEVTATLAQDATSRPPLPDNQWSSDLAGHVRGAYQQPAAAPARAPQEVTATLAQDATVRSPLPDSQSTSDLASQARAIVTETAAQAAGGAAATGTPSDPESGAGRQPLMTAGDHDTLPGVRSVPVAQPLAQFDSALASAMTVPDAAARVATIPNEAHVASSIVQSMRLQMRDGVGTAVVHLEPDYLGPVTISLRVSAGAVTASLHAENPQVRAWIEANEPLLRQGLSEQGLSLDRLLVTAERASDDQETGPQGRQQPRDQPPPRRQSKPDESRTFEVIV